MIEGVHGVGDMVEGCVSSVKHGACHDSQGHSQHSVQFSSIEVCKCRLHP